MEKDDAIRNQKVFVRFADVTELTKRYFTTSAEYAKLKEQGGTLATAYLERKRTYEQIIDLLQLPIPRA